MQCGVMTVNRLSANCDVLRDIGRRVLYEVLKDSGKAVTCDVLTSN